MLWKADLDMQVQCKAKQSKQWNICCSDGVQASTVSAVLAVKLQMQMQLQMWSVMQCVQRLGACTIATTIWKMVPHSILLNFGSHGAVCKAFGIAQSKGCAADSSLLLCRP